MARMDTLEGPPLCIRPRGKNARLDVAWSRFQNMSTWHGNTGARMPDACHFFSKHETIQDTVTTRYSSTVRRSATVYCMQLEITEARP
uniref:Uncharacterized protein n=1 Tax=Setaria italica TaxID=4555 RepID=K3ZGL7_SETIT